jgi:hypothetical protein
MKATTIIVKPSWGQTLSLLEKKLSIRILKTDGDRFRAILDAGGYRYKCTDESFGEFERFALTKG